MVGTLRLAREPQILEKETTVAAPTAAGLSRVTIVAPLTRVDLALPSDIPLADLLPTLLRYAGDGLADDPTGRDGWTLSRLGGVVLDNSRTPSQLDIRDGEMLYLRPRGAEAPELAFDDVVDAVATATTERAGRWRPATSRIFGLTLAVVALVGGAVAILFAGPPQVLGGLAGLAMTIILLLTATVLSRALGQSTIAVIFALVALLYALVGGLLIAAGDLRVTQLSSPHLLIAAAALLTATVIATVGVADAGPMFLGAGVCAVALVIGAMICLATGAPGPAGAAIVVAVTFATLPGLPMISYRLARLPIPSVPSGPEDLKTDTESVDGQLVLSRSERADGYLAALIGALAVIGAVAGLTVVTRGDLPGVLLAAVLGLLMLARARWFVSRRQRLPLLLAGSATVAVAIGATYLAAGQLVRLTIVPSVLVMVAAISAGFGMAAAAERKGSPVGGRILDILEVLLIVAIIPLAVWISGLYSWVRSLRG